MNSDARRCIQVKLTVDSEEHPQLFEAISRIRHLRKRSARLRDLAARGLIDEQRGHGALGSANASAGPQMPMAAGRIGLNGDTVDAMLEWGDAKS